MRRYGLAAWALLLLVCGGCAIQAAVAGSAPPEGSYRIYYAAAGKSIGGAAVEYEYWTPEGAEPLLEGMLAAVFSPPAGEGLSSPYPYGVSLRAAQVDQGVLRLDLSEQYGELTGIQLTLANYCLALTLCQLEGVEAVRVTVEGRELPYRGGLELRAQDVVLTGDEEKPVYVDAALWFCRSDGAGLGVEMRQVLKTEDDTSPKALLDALAAGPEGEDGALYTLIPPQTQVRSATVEEGVCTVDFSREFLTGAEENAARDRLLLYAVVNTLAGSLENVRSVQFLVEGEPLSALGGLPAYRPIEPDFSLERMGEIQD